LNSLFTEKLLSLGLKGLMVTYYQAKYIVVNLHRSSSISGG